MSTLIIIYVVINELKTDQVIESKTVKFLAVELALFNHMIGNWGKYYYIHVNFYKYVSEQDTRCRT